MTEMSWLEDLDAETPRLQVARGRREYLTRRVSHGYRTLYPEEIRDDVAGRPTRARRSDEGEVLERVAKAQSLLEQQSQSRLLASRKAPTLNAAHPSGFAVDR